jgi:hypothetical protein
MESRLVGQLEAFAAALDELHPGAASEADLRTFRHATTDLERLPQNRRRTLSEQRAQLIARYASLLEQQRSTSQQDQLLALKRWDEAMTAAELTRQQGGDPAIPDPPANAPDLLETRLASAGQAVPIDAARRLTIKAELVAGLESPAEDQPLRLQVQVERLQAGLSGKVSSEDPHSLAQSWCGLGPKSDGFAPLRERLFAALTSRYSRSETPP